MTDDRRPTTNDQRLTLRAELQDEAFVVRRWSLVVRLSSLAFILLALLTLSGCAPTVLPVPSATPRPALTDTPAPTATFEPTAAPTATPPPTATVTASPLPPPTTTDTPTLAPTATATPVPPGGVYFSDNFSDPNSGWPQGESRGSPGGHEYRNGAYEVWAKEGVIWVTRRGQSPLADLEVEVKGRPAGQGGQLAYGLVFRARPDVDTSYAFMVSTAGAYTLGRQSGRDWIPLRDWTFSPAILRNGQSNRLKVVATGTRLAGFVNDQLVIVLDDHALSDGEVGLMIADFDRAGEVRVVFDNFSVRRPDQATLAQLRATPAAPPAALSRPPRILKPIPTALPIAEEPLRIAHGATIHLVSEGRDGLSRSGTGTVVGPDGRTAVTAFHVVGDPATGELYNDVVKVGPFLDWRLTAHVVETAPDLDLAVIRVDPHPQFQGFAIVPMGDSDALNVGDTIYTLSYPGVGLGSLITTHGVALGVYRDRPASSVRYIVTDAEASPGSSGGVAVNQKGELIGIVTALILRSDVLADLGYPELDQATVLIPVNLAEPLVDAAMSK
jgi:S1-C subfamily serine protease